MVYNCNSVSLTKLKSKIERLGKNELFEIFKIVHKNNSRYTHNKNGVFLDLNEVSDQCLVEIRAFIEFIDVNRKHIQEIETKISENKTTLDSTTLKNDFQADTVSNASRVPFTITCDYSPFVQYDNLVDGGVSAMEGIPSIHEPSIHDEEAYDEVDMNDDEAEDDIELNDDDRYNEQEHDRESSVIVVTTAPKKKRVVGICHKIMKKCKNINSVHTDADDIEKDYYEENGNHLELAVECAYL